MNDSVVPWSRLRPLDTESSHSQTSLVHQLFNNLCFTWKENEVENKNHCYNCFNLFIYLQVGCVLFCFGFLVLLFYLLTLGHLKWTFLTPYPESLYNSNFAPSSWQLKVTSATPSYWGFFFPFLILSLYFLTSCDSLFQLMETEMHILQLLIRAIMNVLEMQLTNFPGMRKQTLETEILVSRDLNQLYLWMTTWKFFSFLLQNLKNEYLKMITDIK